MGGGGGGGGGGKRVDGVLTERAGQPAGFLVDEREKHKSRTSEIVQVEAEGVEKPYCFCGRSNGIVA